MTSSVTFGSRGCCATSPAKCTVTFNYFFQGGLTVTRPPPDLDRSAMPKYPNSEIPIGIGRATPDRNGPVPMRTPTADGRKHTRPFLWVGLSDGLSRRSLAAKVGVVPRRRPRPLDVTRSCASAAPDALLSPSATSSFILEWLVVTRSRSEGTLPCTSVIHDRKSESLCFVYFLNGTQVNEG